MNKPAWVSSFLFAFLLCSHRLPAQGNPSAPAPSTGKPSDRANAGSVFLHTDKNVYMAGERIWFAAYLLQSDSALRDMNSVLQLTLFDSSGKKRIQQQKFLMDQGLSSGDLQLRDSLTAGRYQLVANTNLVDASGKPVLNFVQPISIFPKGKSPMPSVQVTGTAGQKSAPQPASIRFFPEGGQLAAGVPNRIAWESLDPSGRPVPAEIRVFNNGVPVLSAGSDTDGFGEFELTPSAGDLFTATLEGPVSGQFRLTAPVKDAVAITIDSAIVNDSIRLQIFSTSTQPLTVLLHDNLEVFAEAAITTSAAGRKIIFATDGMRTGIKVITILDSSGQAVAERLVYTGFDKRPFLAVMPDSTVYSKLSPVGLQLKLGDSINAPAGLFSIAVVKANRINNNDLAWIEEHYASSVNLSPINAAQNVTGNRFLLEKLLLTKGWRKYISPGKGSRSIRTYRGNVSRSGRPLKKKVQVGNMTSGGFSIIETDEKGSFELPEAGMIVPSGKEVLLLVTGKDSKGFTIGLDAELPVLAPPALDGSFRNTPSTSPAFEPVGSEPVFELGGVTVKSRRRDLPSFITDEKPGVNPCGDYVDKYGYLNYPPSANSEELYQPVRGKGYLHRTDLNERGHFKVDPVAYGSCLTETGSVAARFPGIAMEKEFYAVLPDLPETQFGSTIYWKTGVLVDAAGIFNDSFFTGQLTGLFRIIVQGITDDGVVSGSASFEVR